MPTCTPSGSFFSVAAATVAENAVLAIEAVAAAAAAAVATGVEEAASRVEGDGGCADSSEGASRGRLAILGCPSKPRGENP